ncbi:hypothetical protein V2P20_12010 [Methylobacter sp. Wu1]|uniref:hypothetical protein n=1 Tax=Methylobacter sp. Wu1 TaxID=3119359 RepID=UPI002F940C81
MNVSRRFILKGIALGGLAGMTLGRWGLSLANNAASAQAQSTRPLLVLVSGEAEQSAFLRGIAAALPDKRPWVQRTDLGMGFVQDFTRLLRSGRPIRIIGLVDDASAALIIELARASDARLPWLGYHSASPGQSRHRLLGDQASSELAARLDSRQWTAILGLALASRGSAPTGLAPPADAAQSPLPGHFVSFAIET